MQTPPRASTVRWLCLSFISAAALVAVGQETAPGGKDMHPELPAELIPLNRLAGTWDLVERHFGADGKIAEREGREEISWALDFRAIRRVYTSGSGEGAYAAESIVSYNAPAARYVAAWYDNTGTSAPTIVTCEFDRAAEGFNCLAQVVTADGLRVTHKVVERFDGEAKRVATTYVKEGDEWVKRLEVLYKLVIKCPDRIRVLPVRELD